MYHLCQLWYVIELQHSDSLPRADCNSGCSKKIEHSSGSVNLVPLEHKDNYISHEEYVDYVNEVYNMIAHIKCGHLLASEIGDNSSGLKNKNKNVSKDAYRSKDKDKNKYKDYIPEFIPRDIVYIIIDYDVIRCENYNIVIDRLLAYIN